jgi:hypothetical protein
MISRAEASGLIVAVLGHGLLILGFLFWGVFAAPNPERLQPDAVEVSLVGEVGLRSEAPEINMDPLAARKSPVEAPVEPEPAPPEPVAQPDPLPVARPDPVPPRNAPDPNATRRRPDRAAVTAPTRPAPPQPRRDVRPTGNLDGLDLGASNNRTASTSTRPAASAIGADTKRSLAAEVIRQIKPHWTPPTGADSEKLRTTVIVRLNPDGSIAGDMRVEQTGVTASNRVQAQLARERAVRAVRLAAPFKLPDQFYNAWKTIAPTLYEDL